MAMAQQPGYEQYAQQQQQPQQQAAGGAPVDWGAYEQQDGVRLSWNVWPNSRLEATKCVVPFCSLVTPLKALPEMPVVNYEPVRCKGCVAVLNPYSRVDFTGKIWICPFCYTRNHFPQHYYGIAENNLPAELFPSYTTIEYNLPGRQAAPPAYLFVVDVCLAEDELNSLKTSITQALSLLPENSLVGLVTFGTQVHVHELGFGDCPKSFVFRGAKEYTAQAIQQQLGLGPQQMARQPQQTQQGQPPVPAGAVGRFLMPITECEFQLTSVLEELQRDAFPTLAENRSTRCTGTALQVAASLLGASLTGMPARCVMFLGGAATDGQGQVVGKELGDAMRSHKDLLKDAAPHFKKAKKFYDGMAAQLVQQGHAMDVFACALDQTGLAEMKGCVERTGGMVVLAESFSHIVFKNSFARLFSREGEGALGLSSSATLEVVTSRDVKVAGALGPVASADKKPMPASVAEVPIGVGGTTAWQMPSVGQDTTVAVFYEISAQGAQGQQGMDQQQQQQFFLQFVTQSINAAGEHRVRVTTITRRWTDGANMADVAAGFDQEAAAVVTARLCTWKMETEEDFDATRWLDRTLIRLCNKFGNYQPNDPNSFQLQPAFSIYPQFMFNLRRSQFVQVFNNSPDETAYFRTVLNRENVLNSLVMIQPMLMAYSFNGPPEPALLDVASITADRILLLDAYFAVVVFHGSTIAQWRKAEYHLQPEHAAFAQLLTAPKGDADAIMSTRFPVPRLVDCDQHGSQARFLLAKLNPSATYNSSQYAGAGGDVLFTDDVSLSVFTEHLKKLAVV